MVVRASANHVLGSIPVELPIPFSMITINKASYAPYYEESVVAQIARTPKAVIYFYQLFKKIRINEVAQNGNHHVSNKI